MTGIKPTYGTVSRYGLIAYGSSLDQIGPIAKDVTDCATILEAIASHDVKDSTSVQREDYDFTSALVDDVRGMKIGIPRDYFGDGLDPEVKVAVLGAAKKLEERAGVTVISPAVTPEGLKKADYMRICFAMLESADTAVFLPDWEDSPGAQLEKHWCEYVCKKMVFLMEGAE